MLAIIPQDPFLFSGTIRENLDPYKQYPEEDIYQILEKCHIHDLVASLGNGLESIIVERGRNFSVGQKQVSRKYRKKREKKKQPTLFDESYFVLHVHFFVKQR